MKSEWWATVRLEGMPPEVAEKIGKWRYFDRMVQLEDGTWVGVEIESGEARRSLAQRTFDDFVSPEHPARVTLRDGRVIEITKTVLHRVREMRKHEVVDLTWEGVFGEVEQPQTPQLIADKISRRLVSPRYLVEGKRYGMRVWAAPEGMHPYDVPKRAIAQRNYIRCLGTAQAMVVQIRVTQPDRTTALYVVAREPIADPEAWVELTWSGYQHKPDSIKLHPEELLTGEQAVPIFRAYIENQELPPPHLLRQIEG